MKFANCFYVATDQLSLFNIPNEKFVLVTGFSDATLPKDFPGKYNEILSSPYLITWYAENLTRETDKSYLVPIGLDYHAPIIYYNEKMAPVESPLKQEQFINNLDRQPFYAREVKVYVNFIHAIRGYYGLKDRADAIAQVPRELMVFEDNFVKRKKTWENMVKYSFVLSPAGGVLIVIEHGRL